MDPIKATAIVLIISVVLVGVFLVIQNFLTIGIQPQTPTKHERSSKGLTINPSFDKSPVQFYKYHTSFIRWVENNQGISNPIESPQQKEEKAGQSQILQNINSKLQNLINSFQTSTQNKDITEAKNHFLNSDLNIQKPNPKSVGDYYKSFIEVALKVSFTKEELDLLKKDDDGKRVLLLEELIEQAAKGIDLNEIRVSFSAWHQLDERILAELNKYPVNNEIFSIHKSLTGWFSYHSNVARLLNEGNLSADQISQLQKEFRDKAESHTTWFGESLSKLKNSPEFVLFPKAQAITCGAVVPPPFYHFGGRVALMLPCNWGIVEAISPPCGGLLIFTYPVLAANPYLYKKPTIGSAVLGRSTLLPGVCPLGVCPACALFPYEAVVLYFSTSGLP